METIIELKYPVEIKAGTVVKSVTLRRLKAKDLKHLPSDGATTPASMIPLIASVSGLSVAEVEEIDLADLMDIAKELTAFSAAYQGTGSGSSGV